jgi:hypothetical protein
MISPSKPSAVLGRSMPGRDINPKLMRLFLPARLSKEVGQSWLFHPSHPAAAALA